jgi:hypothetical protein
MRANIVANEVLQPRESACRDYAASIVQRLDARLAKEAGATQ